MKKQRKHYTPEEKVAILRRHRATSLQRTSWMGGKQEIHAERDRKLEAARKQRQIRRQQAA